MESLRVTQKEILNDLCNPEKWIAAKIVFVAERDYAVAQMACQIKIPREVDTKSFENAAAELLHKIGLECDVETYPLLEDDKHGSLLFIIEDPKLVTELTTLRTRYVGEIDQKLCEFLHQRDLSGAEHSIRIDHFRDMMEEETTTRYIIENDEAIMEGVDPSVLKYWQIENLDTFSLNSDDIIRNNISR